MESTIACGGSTTPDAIREIKRMGFKTVVNLRLASEPGALVDEEGAIVRSLGMTYVHLPFNIQTPDPKLVENFMPRWPVRRIRRPTCTAQPAAAQPRCG